MVRVGPEDGNAEVLREIALREPLDRRLCADRHENGSFDRPVRRMKQAGAGAGVRAFSDNFEGDWGQLQL